MKKREDQDYLGWLTFQPSWLDGAFSGTDDEGRQRNIACHVRRSGDSGTGGAAGTGYKPLWSAVPMTFRQHNTQSSQGELACIAAYANYRVYVIHYEGETMEEKAKSAFNIAARHYKNLWKEKCSHKNH